MFETQQTTKIDVSNLTLGHKLLGLQQTAGGHLVLEFEKGKK